MSMSLYERIRDWITGAEEVKPQGPCVFDGFPVELYEEVFKQCDVETLKSCKKVCLRWYTALSDTEVLSRRTICTWNGNVMGIRDYIHLCFRMSMNRINIESGGVRIIELDATGFMMVSHISAKSFFQHVNHVQIVNMELLAAYLTTLVSKLDNLVSLELNEVRLTDTEFQHPPTPDTFQHWQKIKTLKIYIAEQWMFNTLHGLTISVFGTYCTQLVNLTFKMFDTGCRLIDQMRPFQNVFRDFHNIIQANARTLKTVTLETFSCDHDRDVRFYPREFEGVTEEHNYTFHWFLTRLADHDHTASGLSLEKLTLKFRLVNTTDVQARTTFYPFLRTQRDLEEFSVSQIYLPEGGTALEQLLTCVPLFCRTVFEGVLTLRPRLPIAPNILVLPGGNLDDDSDEDGEDEDDDDDVPPEVAPVAPPVLDADADDGDSDDDDGPFDEVPAVVPLLNGDSDSDDEDDPADPANAAPHVLNADADFDDSDDDNVPADPANVAPPVLDVDPDDDDSEDDDEGADPANVAPPAGPVGIGQVLMHMAINPQQHQEPPLLVAANLIALLENRIVGAFGQHQNWQAVSSGYFDSSVELNTPRTKLMLRFVGCRSWNNLNFGTRNIQSLTQIKIQEIGVKPRHKIVIGDGEIQTIITSARNLKDLWLEYCDLRALTDFGLTGIAPDSSQRMLGTRNFDLRDGDLVGSPVSAIQNLRSLKLSEVGHHVTDVTAYHAFNGLASLTHFGIYRPMMSNDGFKRIRDLFKFNQIVQFEPRTNILLDTFSPAEPPSHLQIAPDADQEIDNIPIPDNDPLDV